MTASRRATPRVLVCATVVVTAAWIMVTVWAGLAPHARPLVKAPAFRGTPPIAGGVTEKGGRRPPPAGSAGAIEPTDPFAVARAVAVAVYASDGGGDAGAAGRQVARWLTAHGAAVEAALAAVVPRSGTGPAAAKAVAWDLLDPRAAPVVIQVDVTRRRLDRSTLDSDPNPQLVRLTMYPRSDGAWEVDDLQVIG